MCCVIMGEGGDGNAGWKYVLIILPFVEEED